MLDEVTKCILVGWKKDKELKGGRMDMREGRGGERGPTKERKGYRYSREDRGSRGQGPFLKDRRHV